MGDVLFNIYDIVRVIGKTCGHKLLSEVNTTCRRAFDTCLIDVDCQLSAKKTAELFAHRRVRSVTCSEAKTTDDFTLLFNAFPSVDNFGVWLYKRSNATFRKLNWSHVRTIQVIKCCDTSASISYNIFELCKNATTAVFRDEYNFQNCRINYTPAPQITTIIFKHHFYIDINSTFPNVKNITTVHNTLYGFSGQCDNVKIYTEKYYINMNNRCVAKNMIVTCNTLQIINTICPIGLCQHLTILSKDKIKLTRDTCDTWINILTPHYQQLMKFNEDYSRVIDTNGFRELHVNLYKESEKHNKLIQMYYTMNHVYEETREQLNKFSSHDYEIICTQNIKTLVISSRFYCLFNSPVLERVTLIFDVEPYDQNKVDRYTQHYGDIVDIIVK